MTSYLESGKYIAGHVVKLAKTKPLLYPSRTVLYSIFELGIYGSVRGKHF